MPALMLVLVTNHVDEHVGDSPANSSSVVHTILSAVRPGECHSVSVQYFPAALHAQDLFGVRVEVLLPRGGQPGDAIPVNRHTGEPDAAQDQSLPPQPLPEINVDSLLSMQVGHTFVHTQLPVPVLDVEVCDQDYVAQRRIGLQKLSRLNLDTFCQTRVVVQPVVVLR